MDEWLLDENGEPILDDDGNKIPNPDYTPPGEYQPDEAAKKWHEDAVAGLKANQRKALGNLDKHRKRADEAEAELGTLKTQWAEFSAIIGDMDADDLKARLEKLKQYEAGELENKGIDEDEILERGRKGAEMRYKPQLDAKDKEIATLKEENAGLKDELHKFKYDGRIQQASIGVLKKGYESIGLAALKTMIREGDDGELVCFDSNGELAIDSHGLPLKPEEFVSTYFTKEYPDLCVKDTAPEVSGGPGGSGAKKTSNPFSKEGMNRTVQTQLIANDPDKARKLMRAAGYDAAKIRRLLGS